MRWKSLFLSLLLFTGVGMLWKTLSRQHRQRTVSGILTAARLSLDAQGRPASLLLMRRSHTLGRPSTLASYALDRGLPALQWNTSTLPHSFLLQRPGHLVAGSKRLYFLSTWDGRYKVEAFERKSGRRLWKRALPNGTEPALASPLVPLQGGVMVSLREQGSWMKLRYKLLALVGSSGAIRWQQTAWIPSARKPWWTGGQLLFPGTRVLQALEWKTGTHSQWKVVGPPVHCGGRWVHFAPLASQRSHWRWTRLWQLEPTKSPGPATQRSTALAWPSKAFSPFSPMGCFRGWFWFPELQSGGATLRWTEWKTHKQQRLLFRGGYRLPPRTLRWRSQTYAVRASPHRFQPLWLRHSKQKRRRLVMLDKQSRSIAWRLPPLQSNSSRPWNDHWRLHDKHLLGWFPVGVAGEPVLLVVSLRDGKLRAEWRWKRNGKGKGMSLREARSLWKNSQLRGDYWVGTWKGRSWLVQWKTGKLLWSGGRGGLEWRLVSAPGSLRKPRQRGR